MKTGWEFQTLSGDCMGTFNGTLEEAEAEGRNRLAEYRIFNGFRLVMVLPEGSKILTGYITK